MSKTEGNERGMVSILVTMIMIVVISLIVLGFAEVTRHNQREALDNQLSTQAYYAAESGVNAASNYLANNSGAQPSSTNCQGFINKIGTYGTTNVLDGGVGQPTVQYTCLLVNTAPSSLQVKPLAQETNTVWHLADSAGTNFKTLTFTWNPDSNFSADSTDTCSNSKISNFRPYGDSDTPSSSFWNCGFGILRVDFVNTNPAVISTSPSLSSYLENNTGVTTFYMVPTYQASGVTSTPVISPPSNCSAGSGNCPADVVYTQCPPSHDACSLTLNFGSASPDYYVRMTMLYQDASQVNLTGTDTNGNAVSFVGGQAVVDSTGQAQDVLRRIQVRIPLQVSDNAPPYALQSKESICKQLTAAPGVYNDSAPGIDTACP